MTKTSATYRKESDSKVVIIYNLKRPLSTKSYNTYKEIGACNPYSETTCEMVQVSDLRSKAFKVAVIIKLKVLKETMFKEIKDGMITTSHQIGNVNKEKLF